MSLFDSVDEMKSWFRAVDLQVEVYYRVTGELPWRVRFADEANGAERPVGDGEDLADAFEAALLRYEQTERHSSERYADEAELADGRLGNQVGEFERWAEDLERPVTFAYRVRERPRFRLRVGNGRAEAVVEAATLDRAVVLAEEARP